MVYHRPEHRTKGANACRNYGYELSNGALINWFDSDDVMHPDFVKNKLNALGEDDDCIISKTLFFAGDPSNVTGQEERTRITENLLEDFTTLDVSWYLPDPMWRRRFLDGKELFDEKLAKGQDRDFHIRKLMESPKIKVIDDYLTYYRQHETTTSQRYSEGVIQSLFDAGNRRISLFEQLGMSKKLKFFLLKQQTKNYPHLYKQKGSVGRFMKIFGKLFVFNAKNIIWFLKFILAVIALNLTGKGSIFLKG